MKGLSTRSIRSIVALICLLPMTVLAGGHGEEEGAAGTFPGYMALQPALVVNLASPRRAQFLRIDMQFFIETNEDGAAVNAHMPAIRDRLIELLGGRDAKSMTTPESREALRTEIQTKLRELMTERSHSPAITAVYFTGFIVQ